ncbi:hypothetical protein AAIA71_29170 (plasmid) [Vibrio harveyi]|uniref:hypothetical protein n=1 Tax=Vibrio harveyi group TaxID=717610 RepID=UPI0004706B5C|nr:MULTISPECIES: hypothetical protein [Vibrio harveyi group]APP09220.1 hypothetical protein BG259_28515 [Vibrio harveyi]EKO3838336.1 hypothetical protein [Vibrio harveyi]
MSTKHYKRKDNTSSSSKYVYVNLSAIDAVYEDGSDSILLMRSGAKIRIDKRASEVAKDIDKSNK